MRIGHTEITIVLGDITRQSLDAIVNAANSHLAGGGGVDGAIHRAGGPVIMAETRAKYLDGCPTGYAVITGGGNLPVKWIIHAVGPVWGGGGRGEAELLSGAYRRSAELAEEVGATSLGFPSLSTGAYGYPLDQAARVAVTAVRQHLEKFADSSLREIRFVVFDAANMAAFQAAMG